MPHFLEFRQTQRFHYWVDFYTKKDFDRFGRFISNGEKYRKTIEKIFISQGLPKELYFVGLIESGYYLGARSRAGAVGPWQFVKGTAKRYGLRINRSKDERKNIVKATKAAASYLKDLHNVFSSWELALSAYNAGENGILRRIMKHGTRDFYELSEKKALPRETINYVPKVLAAMHIIKNAKKYGFSLSKDLKTSIAQKKIYRVRRGDNLYQIGKTFNLSPRQIKKMNDLKSSKIYVGQKLIVSRD